MHLNYLKIIPFKLNKMDLNLKNKMNLIIQKDQKLQWIKMFNNKH